MVWCRDWDEIEESRLDMHGEDRPARAVVEEVDLLGLRKSEAWLGKE